MQKVYVVDTSVLVHDPQALEKFEGNRLVIPITVVEELDGLRKGQGLVSYAAREALRRLDSYRGNGNGGQHAPIKITVEDKDWVGLSPDDRIIRTAFVLKESSSAHPVILISKDTAVRIKAEALGIEAEDYQHDKTGLFRHYGKVLNGSDYTNGIESIRYQMPCDRIFRLWGVDHQAPIKRQRAVSGISPRNIEQECAIDALTSEEACVVALTGQAGSGKTLLALSAGLHLYEKGRHEQIIVTRPIVPVGNDLGYLPGELEDKLRPWMQPIFDNLEVIVGTPVESKDNKAASKYRSSSYLLESAIVHVEPITYIRGRSLPRRFLIVDEAQNLRPLDVKTILTRAGEGTKVVFTGDLDQIDTPYLDAQSNGLSHLISRFINEQYFCYLHLARGARSVLAERAAVLL
jgi:PhoH-like ATPase